MTLAADMPRVHQTSPEIQWAIVLLSRILDFEQIAMSLDLSVRSVQRIVSHFHTHGTIPNPGDNVIKKERKGNRHLRDVDVEVRYLTSWLTSN